MSPELIAAWFGLPSAIAGALFGAVKVQRKVFRYLDRIDAAVKATEVRSVQLEHNGGSSMRDDALASRVAAETVLAIVQGVSERLDRHIEQHANQ